MKKNVFQTVHTSCLSAGLVFAARWATSAWEEEHTEHPESEGVVVAGDVVSVGLFHTEQRGDNGTEAAVEESERGQHGVTEAVPEDELPLGGDDHPGTCLATTGQQRPVVSCSGDGHQLTCDEEEVADEYVGHADIAPPHERQAESRQRRRKCSDGQRGLRCTQRSINRLWRFRLMEQPVEASRAYSLDCRAVT